jgi:predicted 2-oxoglutarate/Fe(II)-dependent dioxygenase YbiX
LGSAPPPAEYDLVIGGRRYSADTLNDDQPLTSFHFDGATVTVNVALSADAAVSGGRLVGVFGNAVRTIPRAEGDVCVHSSSLLHGVTMVRAGVRYSLILFFSEKMVHTTAA